MKRILSISLAFIMALCCLGINAFAQELSAEVYVTIADKGTLTVTYEEVTVTDIDEDGALTVNDALYAAHEEAYNGGAASGYSYYTHKDYGLCIGKLWGDASGNYGYYLNNASCWSLADTVKDGDSLYAFVYSDGKFFSDTYCYFEENSIDAQAGEEVTLELYGAGYDESWNPISVPVAGATITVDGEATEIKTDENGSATITLDGGTHVISAVSADKVLVPPVCIAEVEEEFSIVSLILSIIERIADAVAEFLGLFF